MHQNRTPSTFRERIQDFCCWKVQLWNILIGIAYILYFMNLNRVLDQSRDGRISFTEFQVRGGLCWMLNGIILLKLFWLSSLINRLLKEAFVCQMLSTRPPSNCLTPMEMERSALLTVCFLYSNESSVQVSLDEFVGILSKTTLHQKIPFNFDCDFVKLYFGKEGKRDITYSEFSQFLHDFHEEWAKTW